jgi:lipopolysaccharide export system permease protein
MKDIAEFASVTSNGSSVFLFSLYQIPHILPQAIPIACVISSMLLFQRMSTTYEMTALRAAGFSLRRILYPVLMLAFLLSLLNFTLACKIAPLAKLATKTLLSKSSANNPFFIFNKISQGRFTNSYVEMGALKEGKKAQDVIFVMNNRSNKRLGIITAKELKIENELLKGKDVSIISSVDAKLDDGFDHLVIENQTYMETKASNFSDIFSSKKGYAGIDFLSLKDLLVKASLQNKSLFSTATGLEIARRLSISWTPLIFTLMGAAFGMELGRRKTKKGLILAILLSVFYLCCFVAAKSMKGSPYIGWIIFFLPYPIIILLSFRFIRNFSKGIE